MDSKEYNKNIYNKNATYWENTTKIREYTHKYIEKPKMYEILGDIKGKNILCIGCGDGEEANILHQKGANIVAFDISEELIKIAKKKYPHIDFQVGDAENFNINNDFDIAYASFVLHYFPSWEKVLINTKKLLKSDGYFLFSIVHPFKKSMGVEIQNDIKYKMLGYKRNIIDRMKFEIYGDYLNKRQLETKFSDDFRVINYHSPISAQINEIVQSGFNIVRIEEPLPIKKAKEDFPDEYDIDCKIPVVLIYYIQRKYKTTCI